MQLFLIRHAQSENNALVEQLRESGGAFHLFEERRRADPPLTPLGEQQAHLLGSHLTKQNSRTCRLFVSAFTRALHTSVPIGRALGLTPRLWPDIGEIGGIYHRKAAATSKGLGRMEICSLFPSVEVSDVRSDGPSCHCVLDGVVADCVAARLRDDGWWHEGRRETVTEAMSRALFVAHSLRNEAKKGSLERVFLVSHGDFLNLLMRALLSLLPGQGRYFHHDNTGVTAIILEEDHAVGGARLMFMNRHLDAGFTLDRSSFASLSAAERRALIKAHKKEQSLLQPSKL